MKVNIKKITHYGLTTLLIIPLITYAQTDKIEYKRIDNEQQLRNFFKVNNIDPIISSFTVNDKNGENLLILTSKESLSHIQPTKGMNEKIDIKAIYYTKEKNNWVHQWTIKDGIDCPGVDYSANILIDHIAITDLNKDNIAEITVPYKMFCGGGVDSETIKVIMRQGSTKLALRGLSLIKISKTESYGGTYTLDKNLEKNLIFKNHLENIWKKIYITGYE